MRTAEPRITWTSGGADRTLDDYLSRNPTTGLLIARGDRIVVERYQYGRTDRHRFTSWSMAKTVTAMLIGIAIDERRIRSVDDLAGTEYGRASLRHLLQMSSGVRFSEYASPGFLSEDVLQLNLDVYMRVGPGGVDAVTPFNDRERPAGTKFAYASVETQVLGLVLTRATGRPVAEYLQEKIWQPIGAEADATWLVDNSGRYGHDRRVWLRAGTRHAHVRLSRAASCARGHVRPLDDPAVRAARCSRRGGTRLLLVSHRG